MKKSTLNNYKIYTLAGLFLLVSCTTSPLREESEQKVDSLQTVKSEGKSRQPEIKQQIAAKSRTQTPAPMTYKTKEIQDLRFDQDYVAVAPAMTGIALSRDREMMLAQLVNQDSYNSLQENGFVQTSNNPLSTFSIDVDTASYANIRRWIESGQLPPVGAVRLEEMVNYFSYDYPAPVDKPLGVVTELGPCPWAVENKLVRIGIKAKNLLQEQLPPSNLVFLIDVSGSMQDSNKLPLLKKSMLLLTDQLTAHDRVSIVVYAGSDRVVLVPTGGDKKEKIKAAITQLSSGGSTHGSKGIVTAYELARQTFMPKGNNRIILASDGDFNVGVTSRGELERLISKEKDSGVFLTVLGFGMGNYHDDTMEILADKGNGNYHYVDSILEAKKVLVKERASTFFTVATDVKIQVEFNPALVGGYRLIGYENRNLADEDFNNDKKDAGDIGADHSVTAVYELLPVNSPVIPKVDQLKYQTMPKANNQKELLTVKLRYKPLRSNQSQLLTHAVENSASEITQTSTDFQFICSVLGFGQLLRHSEYAKLTYPQLISMAKKGRGSDSEGYRAEFIKLLETAELIGNNR